MATSKSKQVLRANRRRDGLCVHCGNPGAEKDGRVLTMCESCAVKAKAAQRKMSIRNVANGFCHNASCPNKPIGQKHHCEACIARSSASTSRRRADRVLAGMCSQCSLVPRYKSLTRCKKCHERMSKTIEALKKARSVNGVCSRCGLGAAVPGYVRCQQCIDSGRGAHAARKLRILDAYGGPVCGGCGEAEVLLLTMDHIAGGGYQHSKEIGGTAKLYTWLETNNFPPGFRVLCYNCNIRARHCLPFPRPNPVRLSPRPRPES